MNIRDIEYFLAVSETQHFRNAAEMVHVSQPTLSMQIKKLEAELGGLLFERTNKEVLITPLGKQILPYAKEVLQAIRSMKKLGVIASDPLSGDLHMGIFPSLAPYLLRKIVSPLKKQFYNIRFYFHEKQSVDLLSELQSGKIDCALLALPAEVDSFVSIHLFDEPFFLTVPRSHPLASKKKLAFEDLRNEELLLLEDGHCLRDQALDVCRLANATEYPHVMGTSIETLRSMVAAGTGITLLPELALKRNEKDIVSIPF
ncbi:MAG: LysR family transcriptional regulator, partial [Bdellovibrionales bacterium]|nr:LysR family transcriptional regulator [Bdellovibrionales bacterium]